MKIKDIIYNTRSVRRFDNSKKIDKTILVDIINSLRYLPCGANLQSLKFFFTNDKNSNNKIFKNLKWAGYLENWNGPREEEQPTAYLIILNDESINKNSPLLDIGIVAYSIMLLSKERGIGSCILGSIDKSSIKKQFTFSTDLNVELVVALGYPKENIIIDELPENNNNIKYYRDNNNIHHVPKKNLKDILINNI